MGSRVGPLGSASPVGEKQQIWLDLDKRKQEIEFKIANLREQLRIAKNQRRNIAREKTLARSAQHIPSADAHPIDKAEQVSHRVLKRKEVSSLPSDSHDATQKVQVVDISVEDLTRFNYLYISVGDKKADLVIEFMKENPEVIPRILDYQEEITQRTLLFLAAFRGVTSIVKILLEKGANTELCGKVKINKEELLLTPLQVVALQIEKVSKKMKSSKKEKAAYLEIQELLVVAAFKQRESMQKSPEPSPSSSSSSSLPPLVIEDNETAVDSFFA